MLPSRLAPSVSGWDLGSAIYVSSINKDHCKAATNLYYLSLFLKLDLACIENLSWANYLTSETQECHCRLPWEEKQKYNKSV